MAEPTENPTGIRYAIVDLNGRSHSYHDSLDEVRAALLAAYDGDDLDDFYVVGYSGEGKAVYGPEPARSLLLAKRTIHRTVVPERVDGGCDCPPDRPGYTNRAGVASCSWCDKPLTAESPSPVVPERGQDEGERAARRLYDLHLHGNGEEPPSCDCEYPNWCLFEAGFKAGVARVVRARPASLLDPDEARYIVDALDARYGWPPDDWIPAAQSIYEEAVRKLRGYSGA